MPLSRTELAIVASMLAAIASAVMYVSARLTEVEGETPHKRLGLIKRSDNPQAFETFVRSYKLFAYFLAVLAILLLSLAPLLRGQVE